MATLATATRAEPTAQGSSAATAGIHVGIIMDGNGRWAQARGLPRTAGHRVGARAVDRVVAAARSAGVGTLSLYAFSEENWERPHGEVRALMRLFERYLGRESARCRANDIRINVIGRRDRFEPPLLAAIEAAEADTATSRGMLLRIAIDHSGRATLERAARLLARGRAKTLRGAWDRALHALPTRDLDLIIRTSGEQRISDFLLLECAYAELFFSQRLWPDFEKKDLRAALHTYHQRDRRFGRVPSREAEPSASHPETR
jgi:undecaprenyl diphosphate synthase